MDQMQESLNALTKRLRAEKTLKEQAQARVQELSFTVAAGGAPSVPDGGNRLGRSDELLSCRPPAALFRTAPAHGGTSNVFAGSMLGSMPRRKPPAGVARGAPMPY